MFSLIITIISIALVAVLALATIYYGGSAFNQGSDSAKASQYVNEGQQLQGAKTLAGVEQVTLTAMADLAPTYVSQVPAGWTTDVAGGVFASATAFVSPTVTDKVCIEVNKKAGFATPSAVTSLTGKVFGCLTADLKVTYKF